MRRAALAVTVMAACEQAPTHARRGLPSGQRVAATAAANPIPANEPIDVHGFRMFLNPRGQIVSRQLWEQRVWEPVETGLFRRVVQPGDTFVDIGAHIGYYTLLGATIVGEQGRVIAFEPDPTNFALLERNVALNGFENVTAINAAVGSERGELELFLSDDNTGDHRIYDPGGRTRSISVELIPLDDIMADRGGRVDFVKMDTQGAECSILAGMQGVIANNPGVAMVLEFAPTFIADQGQDPETCMERLSAQGFWFHDIVEYDTEVTIEPITLTALFDTYPNEERYYTNLFLPPRTGRGSPPP